MEAITFYETISFWVLQAGVTISFWVLQAGATFIPGAPKTWATFQLCANAMGRKLSHCVARFVALFSQSMS